MKLRFFALISLFVMLASCSSDEPRMSDPEVERTVLVYMAACNDLGDHDYDDADIAEMQTAVNGGALQGNRLVVFRSTAMGNSLIELTSEGQKVLKEYADDISPVTVETMTTVAADVRRLAPSHDFGMIMWSHGTGWLEDGIADLQGSAAPLSWGSHRGQRMNIKSLQRAMETIRPDFIYFDACYMASVEVVYQLRNATDYIIGSTTEIPAAGMPYDKSLPYLLRPGNPDYVGAARATFAYYDNMSNQEMRTCTMSVIKTSALDDLAACTRRIYDANPEVWPQGYVPQQFMLASRCYYFDFAHYVEARCNNASLLSDWHAALSGAIIYSAATPRLWDAMPLDAHCGLSTFIYRNDVESGLKNYNTLAWAADVCNLN